MKYGICLPIRRDCSIEFNIELAEKAELLGFDSVWVSDHVVIPDKSAASFSTVFYDPFILLAAIASRTNTIKLGTSVIILPYRNPVVVAKMAATLDVLSCGRLIMGVAPGWLKEEFETLNADFVNRGKITDEYIKVIRELWKNNNPEINGENINFKDISFYPKPFENRIPDIWVGGSSGPAKRRALGAASGWQPTWLGPEEYLKCVKELKMSAKETGKNLTDFTFSIRNRIRLDKPGVKHDTSGDPSYIFKGSIENIIEEVSRFEKSGAQYVVFDPEAESDDETFDLIETISEKIIKNRR